MPCDNFLYGFVNGAPCGRANRPACARCTSWPGGHDGVLDRPQALPDVRRIHQAGTLDQAGGGPCPLPLRWPRPARAARRGRSSPPLPGAGQLAATSTTDDCQRSRHTDLGGQAA